MFSCRDAIDLMTDERDGALRGKQRWLYGLHVLICPYCRTCRRQLGDVVALATETRREPDTTEPETKVLEALRARRAEHGEST
jgi:hypothetical protein